MPVVPRFLDLSIWEHARQALVSVNDVAIKSVVGTPGSFESFLHEVGSFFGKDPAHWEPQGQAKTSYREEDLVR